MNRLILGVLLPVVLFAGGISFNGSFNASFTSRPMRKDTINPANTLQLGVSGGVNIFGVSAGLSLFFNSDDKFTPRASSFYSLTPTWGWGRLYIGDFSPSFSSLTLSGIPLRGAGLELFPGSFKLFAVSGVKKGTNGDSASREFSKYIWGLKLGFGRNTGTHIALINSKDIPSSLADTVRNGKMPQENWVAEIEQMISIKKTLSVKAMGAVSLITRNIYALPVESDRIPSWANNGFKFNTSSSIDYAYRIETGLRLRRAFLSYTHSYIGPGFESHGLSGVNNDRVEDRANLSLSLGKYGSIGANANLSRDNLLSLKDAETKSMTGNLYASLIPSRKMSFMGNAMISKLDRNSAESDTQSLKNTSTSISLSASYRVSKKVNLGINTSITNTGVTTVLTDISSKILMMGARFNHRVTKSMSYGLGLGMVNTQSDTLISSSLTPSLNLRWLPGERFRLSLGIRGGISKNRNFVGINIRSIFRVTRRDAISMRLVSANYTDRTPSSLTIKISYSRGFGKKVF